MVELEDALELFDSEMEFALLDSEKVLRDHGATASEIEEWRKDYLPGWYAIVRRHREELIRIWCEQIRTGPLN